MHSTPISIPQAPHNFTLTYIHSQLSSFAYSTKLTSLLNFSSVTSAVKSANNSRLISNLPPFAPSSYSPFASTLTFTSRKKHNMIIFCKICKKYNEIQLTKNKMDLNNQKMKNHPYSPRSVIQQLDS